MTSITFAVVALMCLIYSIFNNGDDRDMQSGEEPEAIRTIVANHITTFWRLCQASLNYLLLIGVFL